MTNAKYKFTNFDCFASNKNVFFIKMMRYVLHIKPAGKADGKAFIFCSSQAMHYFCRGCRLHKQECKVWQHCTWCMKWSIGSTYDPIYAELSMLHLTFGYFWSLPKCLHVAECNSAILTVTWHRRQVTQSDRQVGICDCGQVVMMSQRHVTSLYQSLIEFPLAKVGRLLTIQWAGCHLPQWTACDDVTRSHDFSNFVTQTDARTSNAIPLE